MAAREAAAVKGYASPKATALCAKQDQESRDGTFPFVPNTAHDEFWRDA